MTAQLDHIAQRPPNGRLGQATAVEQSRAVAEVQAQVIVAQQMPRDIGRAVAAMHRSCAQKSLADQAFYSFRRAGQVVSGPSVQLARELARCFGNMNHGIAELLRDDVHGQSEMMAFAWDLETNTRSSTTFIVPHRRDRSEAKGGSLALTEMRDIYENNANNGARRLREMIFAILPGWFTEDAVAACYETLAADESDGKTHAERTENAITRFKAIGITVSQLEQRTGAPSGRWSPYDLAQLGVLYRSIQRGEIRKEDEFPAAADRVTAAEITGKREPENPTPAAPAAATEHTADPVPAQTAQPAPAAKGAVERLDKLIRTLDLGPDEDVRALLEWLTGAPWTATRSQVAQAEKWLGDHLRTASNDVVVAAGAAWKQYNEANPQAGDDSA